MIRNERFKKHELNDEQLDFVTGGKQLTYDYVEAFKQMLSNSAAAKDNFRDNDSEQKKFFSERVT